MLDLPFQSSYATELDGLYLPWKGAAIPAPAVLRLNRNLARELGLDPDALMTAEGAAILSGAETAASSRPLAQAYAGHQFGGFSPQLGDGRALLLGELTDVSGHARDIHLKGSGRTPFSRGGDGKAALGPVLREYLIGEAMYALGVPTTRALAALTTGETIMRDEPQPGAVLARVAASHIRIGTFQFFAARGDVDALRRLTDYTIRRHAPELAMQEAPALGLLRLVIARQSSLIAKWIALGFVHGVMNTDNMTISGETIDYGPCAFIDAYDPQAVYSSIDAHGRYAYGNQPKILQWNLARFAETLLPLISPDDDEAVRLATAEINTVPDHYEAAWRSEMGRKFGFLQSDDGDPDLVRAFLDMLSAQGADFIKSFRQLSRALRGDAALLRQTLADAPELADWLTRYLRRIDHEAGGADAAAQRMDGANPLYIPRNHLVEEALSAAVEQSDMRLFDELLRVISQPFSQHSGREAYEEPAPPSFGRYATFCGT